jgi:hypothetical protein
MVELGILLLDERRPVIGFPTDGPIWYSGTGLCLFLFLYFFIICPSAKRVGMEVFLVATGRRGGGEGKSRNMEWRRTWRSTRSRLDALAASLQRPATGQISYRLCIPRRARIRVGVSMPTFY